MESKITYILSFSTVVIAVQYFIASFTKQQRILRSTIETLAFSLIQKNDYRLTPLCFIYPVPINKVEINFNSYRPLLFNKK